MEGVVSWRKLQLPDATDDSAVDDRAARQYAAVVEPLNRRVYEMHGADRGYRYRSPVICPEDGEPPPDDSYTYRASTWPGAHLPHVWLQPGLALYDRIGQGFALLRLGAGCADTTALEAALKKRRVPLQVIETSDSDIRAVLERDIVLVRPDLHIVWRGNQPPSDPEAVAAMVTGP